MGIPSLRSLLMSEVTMKGFLLPLRLEMSASQRVSLFSIWKTRL